MEHEQYNPDSELETRRLGLVDQIVDLKLQLDAESDPHKQTVLKSAISKAEHQLQRLEEDMGITKYKKAA